MIIILARKKKKNKGNFFQNLYDFIYQTKLNNERQ